MRILNRNTGKEAKGRKAVCIGTIYLTFKHLGRLKKARSEHESSKSLHFGGRVLLPSVQRQKGSSTKYIQHP
jgi:hypothetical protein